MEPSSRGPACDWPRDRARSAEDARCPSVAEALVMVIDTSHDRILDERNLCTTHTREMRQANDRPGRRVDIFPLA